MLKQKIMIVEDEFIIAEDMQFMLEALGFAVTGHVDDGESALELIEKDRPDLVLMDIIIKGGKDGISMAEEILEKYGIPVVFVTAHSDENTAERARLTGTCGYVLKPIDSRILKITIDSTLFNFRAEKHLQDCETWFHSVLDALDEGLVVVDKEGAVKFINSAASGMTGVGRREAAGMDMDAILGTDKKFLCRTAPVMNGKTLIGTLLRLAMKE